MSTAITITGNINNMKIHCHPLKFTSQASICMRSCIFEQLRWSNVRASAFAAADLGLILSWVNSMTLKLAASPASRSPLLGQSGEQAGKFTSCAVGKDTYRNPPILEWQTGGWQLLNGLVVALGLFSRDRRINTQLNANLHFWKYIKLLQ